MKVVDTCPRCNTDRKYERTEMGKYGCTSWWHQFLMLPDIWLVAVPTRPVPPPVEPYRTTDEAVQGALAEKQRFQRSVPPPSRAEKTSVMPYGEADGMGVNGTWSVSEPMIGVDVGGMKHVDSDR